MQVPTDDASQGARQRVRAELTAEIVAVARRHLAEHGADGLSVRAVACDVGMVSSAVYRYFPSRDDLLTALIVSAYDAVGTAAEEAEAKVRRPDLPGRWLAVATGVRAWALRHPHEWALIFGSPVPGYVAPADTLDPSARIPLLLLAIAADHAATPASDDDGGRRLPPMPRAVRADLRALRTQFGAGPDDHQLTRWIAAWTMLVGSISFELFGHLHNVITDHDHYFAHQMRSVAHDLGLYR